MCIEVVIGFIGAWVPPYSLFLSVLEQLAHEQSPLACEQQSLLDSQAYEQQSETERLGWEQTAFESTTQER